MTAGGLLGAFLLARFASRATEADVLWAVGVSTAVLLGLWLGARGWAPVPFGRWIAWPWYSLMGGTLATGVGFGLSLRHARPRRG